MRNAKGQFMGGSIPTNKKPLVLVSCAYCLGTFAKDYSYPAKKYCTHKCSTNAMKGIPKSKAHIEKMVINNARWWKGKKLSKEHAAKSTKHLKPYQSGEKHWAWKGGITPVQKKLRFTKAYSDWRTAVFERDNYTCQMCGQYSGKLNADHHPISYAKIVKSEDWQKLDDISNGRTLCYDCHLKTPNYGGRGRLVMG